ncbi:MAG: hypothetical protein GY771_08060, partial [bacterium]|nr:hypothetical protein [bacterium]
YSIFQAPSFLIIWWVAVIILTEAAIFLTDWKIGRKIGLGLLPPLLVAVVYAVNLLWKSGSTQIIVLVFTCLVLYGGIVWALFRSATHQRKLKRGEIAPPPDAEEDEE